MTRKLRSHQLPLSASNNVTSQGSLPFVRSAASELNGSVVFSGSQLFHSPSSLFDSTLDESVSPVPSRTARWRSRTDLFALVCSPYSASFFSHSLILQLQLQLQLLLREFSSTYLSLRILRTDIESLTSQFINRFYRNFEPILQPNFDHSSFLRSQLNMTTAISPLSPGSKLDGWETPITSAQNSPVPEKCFELPDYDPKQRRNHHRSSDSNWNSGDYPKQAPPLPVEQIPKRPKPTRLATPNSGYPFPWVMSRGNTPEELPTRASTTNSSTGQPATTPLINSMSTNSPPEGSDTSSNSSSSDSRPPSSSFSDHSGSSSNSSSSCSTPRDEPPSYSSTSKSQPTTPSEVQERRTKNASRTPGAPPPMGFIGTGHAHSYIDYKDVQSNSETTQEEEEEETNDDNEDTPRKPLNPLVAKLQGLSVERKASTKVD